MRSRRMIRRVAGLLSFLLVFPAVCSADVKFDLTYAVGKFGIGREAFDRPVDVAEDRDENIFVLDQGNSRVQVLDRRGRFVREWGGRGFTPGFFDTPSALALDRSTSSLYVVDTLNHRIQKFDVNGKLLLTVGRLGSLDGEFNKPADIALDKKGNVYVADAGNDRVQKFDASGKFIATWSRFARRRGAEIRTPMSLAYSDEGFGAVYVLNAESCLVQKYDIDGNLLGAWEMHRKGEGIPCGPSRIRIEPRRYTVYIADAEAGRVLLYDKDGEPLGTVGEGKVPFRRPGGLFVNVDFGENALVADTGNNLIQKLRRVR